MSCHETITGVFDHIRRFFDKTLPGWIDKNVVPILHFVEGLKFIENGVAPVIEVLYPNISPELLNKINDVLTEICAALEIEINCSGTTTDLTERIQCIALHLSSLQPEHRNAIEIKLASWLTRATSGETVVTPDQIDAIVQFEYSHIKHDSK